MKWFSNVSKVEFNKNYNKEIDEDELVIFRSLCDSVNVPQIKKENL